MLATSLLCTIYRFLDYSFLFSHLLVAKVGFFIACFEMSALSACMYRNFIFVSFVISYFSLCFLFCMSVFVDRTLSFLISCRFQLKILITIVLLIDSFLLSLPFRCQYRELFCPHKPSEHIKTQLAVQVAQGLARFHKLKFKGFIVRRRLLYTAKGATVLSRVNILLANITK